MINFNKIAKTLKNITGVHDSLLPSNYVELMIKHFPENREDLKFQAQLKALKLNLPRDERILLSMIFEKLVNEIPHLLFIAKQENQRSYFLNDESVLNPIDYKLGDIVVPKTNNKYEVKSYTNLTHDRVKRVIKQYKENNFDKNPIKFNILFDDVKDYTSEKFKQIVSDEFGIQKNSITLLSFNELRQELHIINTLDLYKIDYNIFNDEYNASLWLNIRNCANNTKDLKVKRMIIKMGIEK